jgi:hypothetical protein
LLRVVAVAVVVRPVSTALAVARAVFSITARTPSAREIITLPSAAAAAVVPEVMVGLGPVALVLRSVQSLVQAVVAAVPTVTTAEATAARAAVPLSLLIL